MKKILLLGLFLNAFSVYGEAIVNIEDQRNEGKVGIFSKIGFQLSGSRGNEAVSYTHLTLPTNREV